MTIAEQLHNSASHREGFDQSCPACLKRDGIAGIIAHLNRCADQNERDGDPKALAIAGEQRRMVGVLRAYRKAAL